MNSIFKKTTLTSAIALSVLSVGIVSTNKVEAMTVNVNSITDPLYTTTLIPAVGTIATATTTSAANSTTLNTYLMFHPNGGLIEQLSSLNNKLTISNAEDQKFFERLDDVNRAQLYNEENYRFMRERQPSLTACVELTRRRNAGGGSASGGPSAPRAAAAKALEAIYDSINTPEGPYAKNSGGAKSGGGNLSRSAALMGRNPDFCDVQDADRPGCSGQVGKFPSADIRASSIFRGPQTSLTVPTNSSLDAEQMKAARMMVEVAVFNKGFPAPRPGIPVPQLRTYEKQQRDFKARQSIVPLTLNNILAMRDASLPSQSAKASEWSKNRAEFDFIYNRNGVVEKFPEIPSAWQELEFEVLRKTDGKEWLTKLSSKDPKALQIEQLQLQAFQAKLTLMLIQRLDENNALQALSLQQSLDPITYNSVVSSSQ